MTKARHIAFFAPIKPPDHHIPSGDRLIAQNLIKAFELAGHDVELASRYICYSKRSNPEILTNRKKGALAEAEQLIEHYARLDQSEQPELWVTYHPYCKAPDWIGPLVSKALGIPYITIEAARTGQGGPEDEWKPWRQEAQAGIKQADLHLVFKPTDRAYLTELLGSTEKLMAFPTFMDFDRTAMTKEAELPMHWQQGVPTLVTTGMMRKGKKDKNFYMLAEILSGIQDHEWNLIVIGGGPEEENIRQAFSSIPSERIHWTGLVDQPQVLEWMAASDIFIWPGWKEPIGMVYLEAQLQSLPVIAYKSMGVPLVVEDGETGILAEENNIDAMRENIITLLQNHDLSRNMGKAGRHKVITQHSLKAAASRFNEIISFLN